MSFNLKQENRKKFQDKSKLKRHHKKNYAKVVPKEESKDGNTPDQNTTPGVNDPNAGLPNDPTSLTTPRTSRSNSLQGENTEENADQPQEPEPVPSNIWRYEEEITIHGHDDVNDDDLVNQIDFKKLYLNKGIDLPQRKKTHDEILDELMRQPNSTNTSHTSPPPNEIQYEAPRVSRAKEEKEFIKTPMSELKKQSDWKNDAPAHLKADEDFLDDLI